jgi:hypothetical protein
LDSKHQHNDNAGGGGSGGAGDGLPTMGKLDVSVLMSKR